MEDLVLIDVARETVKFDSSKPLYIAQIDGFTIVGNVAMIQEKWNNLKAGRNFSGKTLKFFAAKGTPLCYTVTDVTPVKELKVD